MTTATNTAVIGSTAADQGSAHGARNQLFARFARWSARVMGSHWSFILSTVLCLLWAVSGPFFDYSDTWQLVINTATTVLTFLAVFLIQNTQNRDGLAIQIKLDELLRSSMTCSFRSLPRPREPRRHSVSTPNSPARISRLLTKVFERRN